jgi:hypothetical protein
VAIDVFEDFDRDGYVNAPILERQRAVGIHDTKVDAGDIELLRHHVAGADAGTKRFKADREGPLSRTNIENTGCALEVDECCKDAEDAIVSSGDGEFARHGENVSVVASHCSTTEDCGR